MHMRFHEEINPICGKQAKQVVQQGVFIWRRQQLKQHNIFFSLLYCLEKITYKIVVPGLLDKHF